MSLNCTTDKYALLYARWLEKPGTLLDLAGYQPGQRLLDLCGGTGAVSLEALRRGADPSTVMLVDLNPRCPDKRIEQVTGDADDLGVTVFGDRQPGCLNSFDLIVIRQAAAYLTWNLASILWMSALLKPGGKLVFNTFVRPKWSFKTYKHDGRRYFEASGHRGGVVWHVQACPSVGIDLSEFAVLNLPALEKRLGIAKFRVAMTDDGKTCRFICTKGVWS